MYFLVCYESRAVYFKHKDVIHNPYLTTHHELHLALMTVSVYSKADTHTSIYMSALGKELDIERHTLHVPGCLRRIEARDTLSRARVIPLPFLHISTKLGIGLGWFLHF